LASPSLILSPGFFEEALLIMTGWLKCLDRGYARYSVLFLKARSSTDILLSVVVPEPVSSPPPSARREESLENGRFQLLNPSVIGLARRSRTPSDPLPGFAPYTQFWRSSFF